MSRSVLVIALCAVVAVALFTVPGTAHAGGFEYAGAGTRSLGRGGAFYARADDPMALLYNPANLASLSGSQLMLNVNLGWFDACYQRPGTYLEAGMDDEPTVFGDDGAWSLGQDFPEVCNEGPPGPSPDLAFTMRLGRDLGIGFGVVAPAAIGHNVYADDANPGTLDGPGGQQLPPPSRYVLLEEQLLIAYPTVGIGWRPLEWLQVGASLQWGLGYFKFVTMARATEGENPSGDVRSELSASDLFIPAANVSIHAIPHDNLDIVLSFRWVDDVEATGDTTLRYGAYGVGREDGSVQGAIPTDTNLSDTTLSAPQPWQLAFGIRYADRISARPRDIAAVERLSRRIEDSMSNERWDVELDVVYEMNSRVDDFTVDIPNDAVLQLRDASATGVNESTLPLPDQLNIRHNWKDQLSVRLGGDYNVIPGMAALRLGGSFETSGVSEPYANLDFIPAQRLGIHAGLTVRLGDFDISLAYAHFFQETLEVSQCPDAVIDPVEAAGRDAGLESTQIHQNVLSACADEGHAALDQISADDLGRIVNAGTYTSNIDVISLGVTWHL